MWACGKEMKSTRRSDLPTRSGRFSNVSFSNCTSASLRDNSMEMAEGWWGGGVGLREQREWSLPSYHPLAAFRVVAAQAESAYQALGFTCRFQRMLHRVENAWGVFQSCSSHEALACTEGLPGPMWGGWNAVTAALRWRLKRRSWRRWASAYGSSSSLSGRWGGPGRRGNGGQRSTSGPPRLR